MPEQNEKISLEKLRNTPEHELIKEIDENLASISVNQTGPLRLQVYYDELVRRNQDKATRSMLCYTKWITIMTVIMTVATVINLIIFCLKKS
jgi:hypothetical protein